MPIIALAAACWVVEHGRSSIATLNELLSTVDADPRIIITSLDRSVLNKSLSLSAIPEMHDRQITATALCLSEPGEAVDILTEDPYIRSSGLATIIW